MERVKAGKKVIVLCMVLSLLVNLFAGCGKEAEVTGEKDTKTEANKESSSTEKENVESKSEEVQVVKWIHWVPEEDVRPLIDAFEAENPNIKIDYEVGVEGNSADHLKKLDLMILSGEKADIIITPNTAEYAARSNQGMFAELTDLIEADGQSFDDIYSVDTRVNDKIYALPGGVIFWYVMLNKNQLDEAGLPVPPLDWTWDDYADYARKLTKGEGSTKRYGSYFHTWDTQMRLAAYNAIEGNHIYNEDMEPNFDNPVFKDFLVFRHELENVEGVSLPYFDAMTSKAHYNSGFYNESFSMVPIGSWTIAGAANIESVPHDFVTTFAPLPRWGEDGVAGRTLTETSYYSINAKSDVKEAAYKFLHFYTTDGWQYAGEGKFSAAKNADNDATLEGLLSLHPEGRHLVDEEALKAVIRNKIDNPQTAFDENLKNYIEIYKEEVEKYFADGQDIDTTISEIMRRCEEEKK